MKNRNFNSPRFPQWLALSIAAAVTVVGTSVYLTDGSLSKLASLRSESVRSEADKAPPSTGAAALKTLRSAFSALFNENNSEAKVAKQAVPPHAQGAPANAAPRKMFAARGALSGEVLPTAEQNAHADKGRILKLDPVQLREWRNLQEGGQVTLPTVSGDSLEGTVNLVQQEAGWVRIGGELAEGAGSFSLSTNGEEVSGMILLPELQLGYKIEMDGGDVLMVERRLGSLVCSPGLGTSQTAATDGMLRKPVAAAAAMPVINTRPGAKGVIFVDFDGETVTDPVWNAGRTINAAPSTLTSDQIIQVLAISAQDYAPFDVTLTTDSTLYAATAAGRRMHVVVTPTDTAAPGSGGVAYVDSWSGAGKGFRSDAVCWVFNQTVKSIAEAVSHEVGHTLGLNHDGQIGGTEYYAGNGGGLTTQTSWAPIMGVGYGRNLVQWSKGEYAQANNNEDDIALIARAANQFGFVQNELANGLKTLPLNGGTFTAEGLFRTADSVDSYQFSTAGGALTATVAPSALN
ncbi:MAG: zinc-dependent metalloprotease family protein, partial [Verrucomicrobiota bacterium]